MLQSILSYVNVVGERIINLIDPREDVTCPGVPWVLDELRADSARLMQPSIDRETRSTPSSSSELTTFGRLIDLT